MNELVYQIAKDLAIYKCDNETYEKFGNRVIYCALVAWIKVQILGSSYTEIEQTEKDYPYVSQRYISEVMSPVIEGLLYTIPHSEAWTNINGENLDKRDLGKHILEKLIFCYQINLTCKTQWLTSSPERIIYFKNNELILGGTDWNSNMKGAYSVGLGVWRNKKNNHDSNYRETFNIPTYNLKDYYKSLQENALWQLTKLEDEDEYEYFSGETGLWHNRAWRKFNKSYILDGIILIRKFDKKYNYILLCYMDDEFFTAKLDEWYYNEKEISRIMYLLEYHRDKPAQFKAKKNGEMIELYCHSILPDAENRILLMASWPKKTYNNLYLREIPIAIWGDIEDVLSGLGINVIFE
ncbi:MAG: hypothetical protein WBH44_10445 [Proteocatella sp.]